MFLKNVDGLKEGYGGGGNEDDQRYKQMCHFFVTKPKKTNTEGYDDEEHRVLSTGR